MQDIIAAVKQDGFKLFAQLILTALETLYNQFHAFKDRNVPRIVDFIRSVALENTLAQLLINY